jgi:XTP/dITP diphosphohydrolase
VKEIYFITHNTHKFEEAAEIAQRYKIPVKWIDIEYEEIQADDLEDIALASCKKLIQIKTELKNKYFFIEDAGLFIESLNGFPGPYSAYIFQTIGNEGILDLMKSKENKAAYFKSVIAFFANGKIKLFIGKTEGLIITEKRGAKGFGFDPIFLPGDEALTFAEMSLTTKNLYSHRQKSLREMFTSLTTFENKKIFGE